MSHFYCPYVRKEYFLKGLRLTKKKTFLSFNVLIKKTKQKKCIHFFFWWVHFFLEKSNQIEISFFFNRSVMLLLPGSAFYMLGSRLNYFLQNASIKSTTKKKKTMMMMMTNDKLIYCIIKKKKDILHNNDD